MSPRIKLSFRCSLGPLWLNLLLFGANLVAKKKLSEKQTKELLETLKARFEKNMKRHKGLAWDKVQARLESNPDKLWSLQEMEATGGEPDVVGHDKKTGELIFFDCAAESPKDRR